MLCCVFIWTTIKFMGKSRKKSVQKSYCFFWFISIIKTKHKKTKPWYLNGKNEMIYMLNSFDDEAISMTRRKKTEALNWRQTRLGHKHSRTNNTQTGPLQSINNRVRVCLKEGEYAFLFFWWCAMIFFNRWCGFYWWIIDLWLFETFNTLSVLYFIFTYNQVNFGETYVYLT